MIKITIAAATIIAAAMIIMDATANLMGAVTVGL